MSEKVSVGVGLAALVKSVKTGVVGEKIKLELIDGLTNDGIIWRSDDNEVPTLETNEVVFARGTKMGVEVLQGLADKAESIDKYLKQKSLSWNDVWYIGNDVNDLGAIEKAKLSICPADGVKKVRKTVDIVLKTNGGRGILSEIATELEKAN